MNLAQAIPPEFAQARFPGMKWMAPIGYVPPGGPVARQEVCEDDAAIRHRLELPMVRKPATVFRADPDDGVDIDGVHRRKVTVVPRGRHAWLLSGSRVLIGMLKALEKLPEGQDRSAVELRDAVAPGMHIRDFCATPRRLLHKGLVSRSGSHRRYRYAILPAGRELLAKIGAKV